MIKNKDKKAYFLYSFSFVWTKKIYEVSKNTKYFMLNVNCHFLIINCEAQLEDGNRS